jgi:hypothetical protein
MAKAERVPVEIVPVPFKIVLTLSEQEARALRDVCDKIGGSPFKSRRMYFDNISEALDICGMKYHNDKPDMTGGIDFNCDS